MYLVKSNNYQVICLDYNIAKEIKEIEKDEDHCINWNLFNDNDIYYDDNCNEYIVSILHEEKKVHLRKNI